MSIIDRYNQLLEQVLPMYMTPYPFTEKERSVSTNVQYFLARTQKMFRYTGLPNTIPQRNLELYLQMNGNACITSVNGLLYTFVGGLGGEPNEYYMPTIYTVANPALKFNKSLKIDDECVVISNDSMYLGLLPLMNKYATLLMENEISMNINSINSRITSLISAGDDATFESATKYLQDILDGKLGVIAENAFLDGVRNQPNAVNNNQLTNLIEYHQYIKASFFNEIGLNANYNMKRESINSGESQLNHDALLPFIDDMLECRKIGVEKINNMFGTSITVSLDSAWEDIQTEQAAENEPEQENNGGDEDAQTENDNLE